MDIAAVLRAIRKGAVWSLDGDDYAGLTWLDDSPVPSEQEIIEAWPQVAYESAYAGVRAERHAAYAAPDGSDAIFLQWQRGDATEQDWLDAVQAVKDAHPYPEAP